MNVKVIAIGNRLMKDDGVGMEVLKLMEDNLIKKNVSVIYGETDIDYSIANVKEDDYIFIIDGASYKKDLGQITYISLDDFEDKKEGFQHSYNFLDLLKFYYPNIKGKVYGIEIEDVTFGLGLSSDIKNKLNFISEEILKDIENFIEGK